MHQQNRAHDTDQLVHVKQSLGELFEMKDTIFLGWFHCSEFPVKW